MRLVPDQAVVPDPLFRQVLARRSNKEVYDLNRPVPAALLAELLAGGASGVVEGTVDPDRVSALRELTAEGMWTEMHTPEALAESVRLIRIGKAEIEANPDGIDLGGAFFEALKAARLLRQGTMTDTSTSMFDRMVKSTLSTMRTSMGYLWITTPANSRADQIATGRDYVRVNLKATELGIEHSPRRVKRCRSSTRWRSCSGVSTPGSWRGPRRAGADALPSGLWSGGKSQPALAGRDEDHQGMSDTKRDDPVHFRFMNEIAIINQLGSRIFERVMPDGMTLPQFVVLNHFVRLQRPSSPQKLASAFQVTKGAMTNTLQHLEAKGYVGVAPDEKDRRGKVVNITPKGTVARDAAIAALDPIFRSMKSAIVAKDIEAALPVLVQVRSFLDAERKV